MKTRMKKGWVVLISLLLGACSTSAVITDENENNEEGSTQTTTTLDVAWSDMDGLTTYDATTVVTIALNETSVDETSENVDVDNKVITITSGGDYLIQGSLDDGQLVVDAGDDANVHLIFDNIALTNEDGAALVVLNADAVVITLAQGSENTLSDGSFYTLSGDDDPDATIYAKDDLTINGEGSLTINGNYNHGIHGTNEVNLVGGEIVVNASADGIKGKDSVKIKETVLTINAAHDGIQSTNAEEEGKGFVYIESGEVDIVAGLDGIQAETQVLVSGGDINIKAGAKASEDESGKGIKAVLDVQIEDGKLDVSSLIDDALHSNGTLTIDGGILTLNAGDDAIHADRTLTLNGGEIDIESSYEGLEAQDINITSGDVSIVADDDGINTSASTTAAVAAGPGGQGMMQDDGSTLNIAGGYILIDAAGDGVDSNGTITMSDGTLIVFGPSTNNEASIDYNGSFTLSGGTILAVGSSGMAQQASASSIHTVMINTSTFSEGNLVAILDDAGELVVAFEARKSASNIVFASESLSDGSYSLMSGGMLNSSLDDSVSMEGSYTGGSTLLAFTINSEITMVGTSQGKTMPGGGQPRPGRK
ncbi:MAG TPA: dockerin type 1 [Erysipelotrichaceae bacterium]|nr:dockerin type 1 [Erysipelotrichaceae bacterium]HBZ41102.1 dockerin type 1 [Erysipelotrichaceae bacterium]